MYDDPTDRVMSQFFDLFHVCVAQENIFTGVDVVFFVVFLGVDGVGCREDPAVSKQGPAPSPVDIGECLPGEVARIGFLPSDDALLLCHGVDRLPTYWQTPGHFLSFLFVLPNALGCAGIYPSYGLAAASSGHHLVIWVMAVILDPGFIGVHASCGEVAEVPIRQAAGLSTVLDLAPGHGTVPRAIMLANGREGEQRLTSLHELVALFAGDNEVIPELVLRLWILDDGELIQGLGLGALDDFSGVAQLPAEAVPRLIREEQQIHGVAAGVKVWRPLRSTEFTQVLPISVDLELVIGAVYLLVVINFKRIQELEVHSEAPLYPDAVVTAQIWWIGLWVLEAGDVARGLRVEPTAALGLAGLPVFLKLVARTAGTEVTSNIVVAQVLASGLQTLLH